MDGIHFNHKEVHQETGIVFIFKPETYEFMVRVSSSSRKGIFKFFFNGGLSQIVVKVVTEHIRRYESVLYSWRTPRGATISPLSHMKAKRMLCSVEAKR